MHEIVICYDRVRFKTKISIDGELKQNADFRISEGAFLQDWISFLPDILKKNYAENDSFIIKFYGTTEDYGIVSYIAAHARSKGMNIDSQCAEQSNENLHLNEEKNSEKETAKGEQTVMKHIPNLHKGKKNIYIEYNPFKVETIIEVDNEPIKGSSELFKKKDQRLQEWIEDLPQILVEEFNIKKFFIKFKGTRLDYDDFASVIKSAKEDGIEIVTEFEQGKEIIDKEAKIKKIFRHIQKGPFEELRSEELKNNFETVCKGEFPVNVIATMSSGKSTLINALMQKELMPAKQEACTAIITQIKDNDSDSFDITAYDKENKLKTKQKNLDKDKILEIMNALNNDGNISGVTVKGDIPFISAKDTSLVIVDTPGPNNSQDDGHKKATEKMLEESSKNFILYIMNATQFATNDDNALLKLVSKSMKVKGKQAKDRFIFVINQLDRFDPEVDSVESIIEKANKYLEQFDIYEANIFPASALRALQIRTLLKDIDTTKDIEEAHREARLSKNYKLREVLDAIETINEIEEKHFEKYVSLPANIREEIEETLQKAQEEHDFAKEALVHTGIISIEAMIRLYVEKYSRPAKIKKIVDTFQEKLDNAGTQTKIENELAKNIGQRNAILHKIDTINEKIKTAQNGINLKAEIDSLNLKDSLQEFMNPIYIVANTKINNKIEEERGKEIAEHQVNLEAKQLKDYAAQIDIEVQMKLERLIKEKIQATASYLLNKYKSHVKDLMHEVNIDKQVVNIDAYKLISAKFNDFKDVKNILNNDGFDKDIISGQVDNPAKEGFFGWFKFWQPDKIDVYTTVRYVEGENFARKYYTPFTKHLYSHITEAKKILDKAQKDIQKKFEKNIQELNGYVEKSLNSLKACISDEEQAKKTLEKTQRNKQWLDNIQQDINNLLNI